MKLTQRTDYNNFYLPTDTSKFIVFSEDKSNKEFDFSKAFEQYKFNFLLIFHKNDVPQIDDALNLILLSKVSSGRKIYWIDELGISDINSCPSITIASINQATQYSNIAFGKDEFKIYIKNTNPAGQVFHSTVLFDSTKSTLSFTVNNSKKHKLIANKVNENEFISFIIPLIHQKSLFGFDSKSTNNNVGSICFLSLKALKNSIQPTTSLLSPNSQNENILFNYKYFIDESYSKNIATISIIYPTLVFDNKDSNFQSYIELFVQQDFLTCFTDELGNNLKILQGNSFINRIAFVNPDSTNPSLRNYFFIPKGRQSLDLISSGNQLLLGNSGTERLDKTKLEFCEFEEILISESENGEINCLKYSDSITSIVSCLKPIEGKVVSYHLDSEKKPLYENNKNSTSNKVLDKVEIMYKAVPIGAISENVRTPIIPTLSFTQNSDLDNLESRLVKLRIKKFISGNAKEYYFDNNEEYITPQGYLRIGNRLDFIKPFSINVDGKEEIFQFSVNNVLKTSDFNLSFSMEDVFFVLNSNLLKDKTEKLIAIFKIREFTIDLGGFDKISADDTFIIFKFSRHSFTKLLNDPTKWSNYGDYKLKSADSSELVSKINDKIKFPSTEDYKYFNDTICKDPNWNGVVIINIPIGKGNSLPSIFNGLTGSQELEESSKSEKLKLQTGMKFQFVAFPVNKTEIQEGSIGISSTSFYGILDYDILNKTDGSPSLDYETVSSHFPPKRPTQQPPRPDEISTYKFLLTKLLIRFENSTITNFQSIAFLQIPDVFENDVEFGSFSLSHPGVKNGDVKENLIRLQGNYQKDSAGNDEFNFITQSKLQINFRNNNVLKSISISKIAFTYSRGTKEYRFDFDAKADINSWSLSDLVSIEQLDFNNIGYKFKLVDLKLPKIEFDVTKLLVFPKIKFNGEGFLSSFPIKFSHFESFKLKRISETEIKIDFDYFMLPEFKIPDIDIDCVANLFSFVFDFDMGTLGDLGGLKNLSAKLLIGWSFNGGFAIGIKLNGPSSEGIHVDLFGAIKLDILKVELCQINKQFVLSIKDARLKIYNTSLPSEKDKVFSAIIFAKKGEKTAWLFSYVKGKEIDPKKNKLLLGVGQRVGIDGLNQILSVQDAVDQVKSIFDPSKNICPAPTLPSVYQKDRNWLIASEDVLPDDWPIILKFIFNDPALYGLYLGFKGEILKGFSIDILYKKLSENLGVYSTEIQLPDELRNQELGAAFLKIPNIGIDIYTNGDWKIDIGFPRNSNDWSRSGFIQLKTAPPFVGFFGFYIMQSKVAALTLFKNYITEDYTRKNLKILQAGFAMRVGLGYYFNKGILYLGASITLYGIMEGAFAFEKQKSLSKLFPDHFAFLGRIGAIAELVGYVDFGILKASVYISLRAEFGLLFVYLGDNSIPGENSGKGIQPAIVYIEGEVRVDVYIKIGCVYIHLKFSTIIRFEYTIGGRSRVSKKSLKDFNSLNLPSSFDVEPLEIILIQIKGIKEIPMIYLPAFSKVNEDKEEKLVLIHSFIIPLFGKDVNNGKIIFTDNNILKDKIIKPFFTELIEELRKNKIVDFNKYETLRSILLTGYCEQNLDNKITRVKIKISMDEYLPTFILGINSSNKITVDKILQNYFDFQLTELKPNQVDNSILSAYKNELMGIPAPISKRIQIVDEDKKIVYSSSTDGFNISLESLVNDSSGIPFIKSHITSIGDFDEPTIEYMKYFYDEYKMQFINKTKPKNITNREPIDLRDEIIIPEFFKMVSLLTLESFYQLNNPELKNNEQYNPNINVDENGKFVFEGIKKWNPNDAIEQVSGQLNYFYNNGLRLPFETSNEQTKPIYELLNQQVKINNIPKELRDLDKIKILIDDKDITKEVFSDDAAKKEMLKFIDGFQSDFLFSNLKKEFGERNIGFLRPFDLIPITIVVQNKKLEEKQKYRFFDIPNKLSQYGQSSSQYGFELNYASYKNDKIIFSTKKTRDEFLPGLTKCLNIEIKIHKHSERVLEIVNVYVKDLNLMNKLKSDKYKIDSIDFYLKQESDLTDNGATIYLNKLTNTYATILKTNLSPRTYPPVFNGSDFDSLKKMDKNGREYWDDSNNTDKSNFIRLLWEALTTNNGGYFLLLDKDFKIANDSSSSGMATYTIVLSFSGEQSKIPVYFNTLKLESNDKIFDGLDDRSHYLFIDTLTITDKKVTDKAILEYHQVMPAHNFGFEILRDRKGNPKYGKPEFENYQNYLPLEFSLQNIDDTLPILSAEKVLPIMPTNSHLSTEDNVLKYNHLSPLVIQDIKQDPLGKNINRYSAVGKKYKLGTNLRDVFGNKTNELDKFISTAEYQHFYFDKLLAIDSWPLIRFSYWFKEYKNNKLFFNISCTCDIKEILELAGVQKDLIDVNKPELGFKYRYDFKSEINKSNIDDNQTDIERLQELIPGILNNLYTILAQLADINTKVLINSTEVQEEKSNWKSKIESLIDKLAFIVTPIDGKYYMPEKNVKETKDYIFEIETADHLKNELNVEICLKRDINLIHQAIDSSFIKKSIEEPVLSELTNSYIWDYKTVFKSLTKVKPHSTKLIDLNNIIREKTQNRFCLGLSSEDKYDSENSWIANDKVIYIINEAKLSAIKITNVNDKRELNKSSYFGINPISNKLWSGDYLPAIVGAVPDSFSSIDLDKCLRVILEKIDNLLQGNNIRQKINTQVSEIEIKGLYNMLISSKHALADRKLKQNIDWVVDDTNKPLPELEKEFRDLLLSGLTNFYSYDGIVKAKLSGLDVLEDIYRLNFSVNGSSATDSEKQYNLVSSKMVGNSEEWYILFDQKEGVVDTINFDIQPILTHIEFDFKESEDSEISQSTWIQLITPIALKDDKYFVRDWPKIKREFPDKPVLINHMAEQKYHDGNNEVKNWDIDKIGLWNYEIEIADNYGLGDIIHVDLIIETYSLDVKIDSNGSNFEGFIAFWARKILETQNIVNGFDILFKDFISDLSNQFNNFSEIRKTELVDTLKTFSFEFEKKTDGWYVESIRNDIPVNVISKSRAAAIVGPLNMFGQGNNVIAVLPKIKVFRNRNTNILNSKFIYETDTIQAESPARPHIKYFNPLLIPTGSNFEESVFGTNSHVIVPDNLALKATAKYLIDTAGKDKSNKDRYPTEIKVLPLIPVSHIECKKSIKPSKSDALFDGYDKTNGYQAFSLALYTDGEDESDLPIFYADTIFKQK